MRTPRRAPIHRSWPRHVIRTEPKRARKSDSIILCCSGPSFDIAKVMKLAVGGASIAAISTAIRVVNYPDYWVFLDAPNHKHGPHGYWALDNPEITKITQASHHERLHEKPSMVFIPMNKVHEDEGRTFMDGRIPYLRAAKRSLLHAVQFFCDEGFTRLIFAGCDLTMTVDSAYCHDLKVEAKRALPLQIDGLNNELECLRAWTPIAAARGIRFVSMTTGSRIGEFMEQA